MPRLTRVLDTVKAVQEGFRARLPPKAIAVECEAKANRQFFARDPKIRDPQRGHAIEAYFGQSDRSQELGANILGDRVLVESQAGSTWGRRRVQLGHLAGRAVRGSHQRLGGCGVVSGD